MCLNPIGSCTKRCDEDASVREPSPEPDHLRAGDARKRNIHQIYQLKRRALGEGGSVDDPRSLGIISAIKRPFCLPFPASSPALRGCTYWPSERLCCGREVP